MFQFGYKIPQTDLPAWWGARAILRNHCIDFLRDRQQMLGTDENAKMALALWLDDVGIPALQKIVEEEHIRTDEEREIRFEKDGYYIEANPRKSFGYLYIGAGKLQVP